MSLIAYLSFISCCTIGTCLCSSFQLMLRVHTLSFARCLILHTVWRSQNEPVASAFISCATHYHGNQPIWHMTSVTSCLIKLIWFLLFHVSWTVDYHIGNVSNEAQPIRSLTSVSVNSHSTSWGVGKGDQSQSWYRGIILLIYKGKAWGTNNNFCVRCSTL